MWRELAEELAGGDWSDFVAPPRPAAQPLGRHADDDRDGDGPVAASRCLARLYDPDHDDEYQDDDEDEGREDEVPADPEALASELTAFLAEQAAEVRRTSAASSRPRPARPAGDGGGCPGRLAAGPCDPPRPRVTTAGPSAPTL